MPKKKNTRNQDLRCSFCGRSSREVDRIISGVNGYICNECIEACSYLLKEFNYEYSDQNMKPKDIKKILDDYVIGQEDAKKTLAVAVYNHYLRLKGNKDKEKSDTFSDVEIQKSNIMLIGPTGSGKTLLAQTLAEALDVPFAIADATSLTEAGYVGEDVENILLKLIQNADMDIKKAEAGIIYIDEIDKISRKSENRSITRDVSGEGVQQALLKIIEGTTANVPPQGGRKHPQADFIEINTKNILFILGGAFDGLERIIESRQETSSMGFLAPIKPKEEQDLKELLDQTEPQDLMHYGLIPELVGRIPVITTLAELDKEALMAILTQPKNALVKQYQKMMAQEGLRLEFTPEAIEAIADKAVENKTGARGLRSIMESFMINIMYEVPSMDEIAGVLITKEVVTDNKEPEYQYIDQIQSV